MKTMGKKTSTKTKSSQSKLNMAVITTYFFTILLSVQLVAQNQTIDFRVDMRALDEVTSVSIKGNLKPIAADYNLTDPDGDGIFEAKISFNTTARRVKFKFSSNGKEELVGSDYRVIWFANNQETKTYHFNEFDYFNDNEIAGLTFEAQQIKEDISVMKNIIQHLHPAIYAFQDSLAFQNSIKQLEAEMLAQPDLINAYKAVSKFAAKIKCSHTFTNPWNQGGNIVKAMFYRPDKLPMTLKRLDQRLFVDKNASATPSIRSGLEILSINGVSTDAVLTALAQYVSADGNNYEKKLNRLSLSGSEKFSLFDIYYPLVFGSTERFDLQFRDHQTSTVFDETVTATSKTNRTKILIERFGKLETSLRDGWSFGITDNKVGVLKIKSFAVQRKEFDWKGYIDQAFAQLNQEEIANLIIDIRDNEGGQGEVGEYILENVVQEPFAAPAMQSSVRYLSIPDEYKKHISTWAKFPYDFTEKVTEGQADAEGNYQLKQKFSVAGKTYKPKKNGFKGKVYLIIDSSNSSATHLMASYAKQMTGITLIGQETGGNQLGTNGGFMFFLRLPNTRIEIDIPVIHMVVPSGSGAPKDGGVIPDIPVEKNWQDIVLGNDTELEQTLRLIVE